MRVDIERSPDIRAVRLLLRERIGDDVEDVRQLDGGYFSRAFAFTADGREYVIRLNSEAHARESFAKDDYAWRHFASPALPIPRIVAMGETTDGFYAISDWATGRTLNEFPVVAQRAALPALLDTLDAVGRCDVLATRGYGNWSSDGDGQYASWHDYLASITANHPDGYYENWHRIFHDSFLELGVYEVVSRQMLRLSARCPAERALIHNDLQFENVLADGERVTGIIDRANALYGDPLYDVAWLAWCSAKDGCWYEDGPTILQAYYGNAPNYAERVACYQSHIGLDDLRFCARNDMRAEYEVLRDRLLTLIETTKDLM